MSLITITSSFGSGGEKIAKEVSEQLGIELFDDHKVQERALSMGISSKELEGIDEKAPRLFDRLFTNKPAVYLDLLGSVIFDIASEGEGLIVGHGAQVFLEDFNCALHVLIHAPEETRSKTMSEEQNITAEAAMQLVHKMDKRLGDFVQYAFNRDWKDSSGYDLVINLEKLGTDWAVKLISDLAGSEEVKTCSIKAIEEMESSSLKRKIDAAIIKNNHSTIYPDFVVEVTGGGKVHLSGLMFSNDELEKVIRVIKNVPGVTEVTSEIVIVPSSYGA